jgi:TonB family protein
MYSAARTLLAVMLLAAVPAAAAAQTYIPPKMIKQGNAGAAFGGAGSVTLKIFVKADGTVGPVSIEKSTDRRDDAAALEIAKNSTYRPGERDGQAIDAFYTIILNFTANSVAIEGQPGAPELTSVSALLRAEKYTEAKAAVQAYLVKMPDDAQALVLLGAANEYLNDTAGALTAFDKAGPIPEPYRNIAAKTYANAAVDAIKAKSNDRAVALATKALGLQESVNALFIRGTAQANAQNYAAALADLERAKILAITGKADPSTLNAIDAALTTAYLFGGQSAKGLELAQALKARDPGSRARVDTSIEASYSSQAAAALSAGKKDEAVTLLEQGAAALPARAAALYVQAASVLAQGTAVDWKRVKAEVDKALAVDANDARANYVAGVALASAKDVPGALVFLQKAKANAGSDAALNAEIDGALKALRARS